MNTYLCPECSTPLSGKVVSNIHGCFCSFPCIRKATKRGYPLYIEQSLDTLRQCFEESPTDFLGTGSDSREANKLEAEWNEKWQKALSSVSEYIKRNAK